MNKKTVIALTGSIGIISMLMIGNTFAQSKLTQNQLKGDGGVKMNEETRYFLKNADTPPSAGNRLIEKNGESHSCHLLSVTKNNKGKFVTEWTCWSEK
jgi:hypothetical protein